MLTHGTVLCRKNQLFLTSKVQSYNFEYRIYCTALTFKKTQFCSLSVFVGHIVEFYTCPNHTVEKGRFWKANMYVVKKLILKSTHAWHKHIICKTADFEKHSCMM